MLPAPPRIPTHNIKGTGRRPDGKDVIRDIEGCKLDIRSRTEADAGNTFSKDRRINMPADAGAWRISSNEGLVKVGSLRTMRFAAGTERAQESWDLRGHFNFPANSNVAESEFGTAPFHLHISKSIMAILEASKFAKQFSLFQCGKEVIDEAESAGKHRLCIIQLTGLFC